MCSQIISCLTHIPQRLHAEPWWNEAFQIINSSKPVRDFTVQHGVALWLLYQREVIFKLGNVYPGAYTNTSQVTPGRAWFQGIRFRIFSLHGNSFLKFTCLRQHLPWRSHSALHLLAHCLLPQMGFPHCTEEKHTSPWPGILTVVHRLIRKSGQGPIQNSGIAKCPSPCYPFHPRKICKHKNVRFSIRWLPKFWGKQKDSILSHCLLLVIAMRTQYRRFNLWNLISQESV